MEKHQDPSSSNRTGRSDFAKRGQSHEERMPEDDSAETFRGEGARSRSSASAAREHEVEPSADADGQRYGSGGSYGYGGGFEHGERMGWDVSFRGRPAASAQDDRYSATGSFDREDDGYEKEGIGHPGKDEKRPGNAPAARAPASGHPAQDDEQKGYSQDSGYAQSGGNPTQRQGADKKGGSKSN